MYGQSLGMYGGLGATGLLGAAATECMKQELASKAAGGPYNPGRCVAGAASSLEEAQARTAAAKARLAGPSTTTYLLIGAGLVAAAGGAYYYYKHRKAA